MLKAEFTRARRPVGQVTAGSVVARRGRRIGFFGLFGSGNFGNDGSLEAMIGLVRRVCPDARLVCFCDGPERVQERLGIEAVAMKSASGDIVTRWLRRRASGGHGGCVPHADADQKCL